MTREEAIEKIRSCNLPRETMEIFEALAPELRLSEDDVMRDKIEKAIRHCYTLSEAEEILNYLKKQKSKVELPEWKIWQNGGCGNSDGTPIALVKRGYTYELVSALGIDGEKYILLSELEKLPGFWRSKHC